MESSPLLRRVTFGLIVLVLAGLGAYLISSAARGAARPPAAAPAATAPLPASSPSASPAPTSAAPAAGTPGIYQWLPFTPPELAAAAAAARQFGVADGTFSYTETASEYGARLQPLASAALVAELQGAYSLPGVAAARTGTRQISVGTAVIESLRAFGTGSLTFVVQITENLTASSGRSQNVTQYAVTLSGSGSSWQVTDIELASAGNS